MTECEMKTAIKIVRNGPYIVTGNVPLSEKIITRNGKGYLYKQGRIYKHSERYSLCRCGKSEHAPFCDGTHNDVIFDGRESASRRSYEDRAGMLCGGDLDLMDDNRCAYARFCHREDGSVWELTENSSYPHYKAEAVRAACECPSGRLVAVEKSGSVYEYDFTEAIEVLQDPENSVSGPLFVKGGIRVEGVDGHKYEVRNRLALCRCGQSDNKPFCDAAHVDSKYKDE